MNKFTISLIMVCFYCLTVIMLIIGCKRNETPPPNNQPCWRTESNCGSSGCEPGPGCQSGILFLENQPAFEGQGNDIIRVFLSSSIDANDEIAGTSFILNIEIAENRQQGGENARVEFGMCPWHMPVGDYYILADINGSWIAGSGSYGGLIVRDQNNPTNPVPTMRIDELRLPVTNGNDPDPQIARVKLRISDLPLNNMDVGLDDHTLFLEIKNSNNAIVAVSNIAYMNIAVGDNPKICYLDIKPSYSMTSGTNYSIWGKLFVSGYQFPSTTIESYLNWTLQLSFPIPTTIGTEIVDWFEPNHVEGTNVTTSYWYNRIINYASRLVTGNQRIRETSEAFEQLNRDVEFVRSAETNAFNAYQTRDSYYNSYMEINSFDTPDFYSKLSLTLGIGDALPTNKFVIGVDSVNFTGFITSNIVSFIQPLTDGNVTIYFTFPQFKNSREHVETDNIWQYVTGSAWGSDRTVQWLRGMLTHELGHIIDDMVDSGGATESGQAYEHETHGEDGALGEQECIMNNWMHHHLNASHQIYPAGLHFGLTSNPHFCKDHIKRWRRP